MVGQAIQKSVEAFRGLRPVNTARDLTQIGRLLNHAFRDEFDGEMAWMRMPVLREVSAYLWAASFIPAFPGTVAGFVWEEDGHIIGNVTMTPDDSRAGYYLISNVAVEEKFRRHGIARQLMQATLEDASRRHARAVTLQVRPHNTGAIRLYQDMGFEIVDTTIRYRRSALPPVPLFPRERAEGGESLRRLKFSERGAAHQLAKESLPARLQNLRPLPAGNFALTWEDRLTEWIVDFLSGQQTTRWGFFNAQRLDAALTLRAQRLSALHSLEIFVRPSARGNSEAWLVAFALEQLADFPQRPIQTAVWSSHAELVNALRAQGFFAQKGLMLMLKEIGSQLSVVSSR